MARREYTSSVKCAEVDCREYAHYIYDTRREQAEAHKRRIEHPYRCSRHSAPDEVVGPASRPREVVVTAVKVEAFRRASEPVRYLSGLFWQVEGERVGSGLMHGPGFRAFASDFPEGARLIISVRVELPEDIDA